MRQSVRIGTVRGIRIGAHWSVVLLLALFAWDLSEYELPSRPGNADVGDWVAGVVGAVVLLLSLLVHEVSHALVARRNGVRARSITLFAFGGITLLEGEARSPGADFRIAAAGPAASVALAGGFAAAGAIAAAAAVHGLPAATLSWLWQINLLLAGFNLVPAAPLDGGRILRAALWRRWGNRPRAALAAARFGRGFGSVLVVAGVLGLFYLGATALWAAFIGFFLYSSASAEEQYALLLGAVTGLTVGQVMTPDPPTVPGPTAVAELPVIFHWRDREYALVVTDGRGSPTGVITADAIRKLRARQLGTTTADQVATPLAEVATARPEEPADVLLERMVSHGGHPALVFDGTDHLVGVVTLAGVERAASWTAHGP